MSSNRPPLSKSNSRERVEQNGLDTAAAAAAAQPLIKPPVVMEYRTTVGTGTIITNADRTEGGVK